MINVLLVEDDIDLASTIVDYLELESIDCDHASNGLMGLNLIERQPYQVIILDINMPKMDGLTLCALLREQGIDTPVLMLTARDTLNDKLQGFNAGSDDYLVKPFAMQELVARLHVLARRRSGEVKRFVLGELELDLSQRCAFIAHQPLKLSPTALKILEVLMRSSPKAISRLDIIEAVWGENQPDSNSLKVHIHHLRKQLDTYNGGINVETIAGVGFAIKVSSEGNNK
ncbi:response regulator transcription factor [Paraglaciecola sp. L1A13]|uniref:response regulator transcription factor n=1 Tax=Paraglaciecola sp. L1A13 TaxID=2686359 RepID=UPI00131E874D|nr:response regulator transcription factor [Paraglaciecola sp. L1A13]